jgi:hypothetical protein
MVLGIPVFTADSSSGAIIIRRSGSGKGRGRSSTPLIRLNIAVVAPMPSASVNVVVRAKPGFLRSWRIAKRRSCNRLSIHISRKARSGLLEVHFQCQPGRKISSCKQERCAQGGSAEAVCGVRIRGCLSGCGQVVSHNDWIWWDCVGYTGRECDLLLRLFPRLTA